MPDVDLDSVPAALRDRPQWLVWRFESKPGDKKPRKVPYYASGRRRAGKQGDDADRAALVTFDQAAKALSGPAGYSGMGFAFLPGDGLVGIDLDGVIDEAGVMQERAAGIIQACASFTEVSPSGKGVHIYCLGETKSHKSNEIGVEVFCGRQFFTVTGRRLPDTAPTVTPISAAVLTRLHQVIDEARGKPSAPRSDAPARKPIQSASQIDNGYAGRDRIEGALTCVSPDVGYGDWIGVGMCLYDALGESDGLGVWDWWSSKGSNYPGRDTLARHWSSFAGRAPGSDGFIFKLAMASGWRPPRVLSASPKGGAGPAGEAVSLPSAATPEPPAWVMDAPPFEQDALMNQVHDSADFNSQFRRNKLNVITPTLYNTLHVLEGDSQWRGVLAFNQFSYRITKRRAAPGYPGSEGEWADIDDVRVQVYLTRVYAFEAKKGTVMDAVLQTAHAAPYHPVREYLNGLKWDGKPRLATMLADLWGVLSTADAASLRTEDPGAGVRLAKYAELAGTKWLVGAVARIMKPGCKLDTMMVFEGGQGDFKSSAIRALFSDEWFSDSKLKIGDKDALAQMQGKWAYEMAEMDAHRKADDTEFKMFLTTQIDRVRWHYGKRAEDVPRQCVFVGSTNMSQYGKDETGMRRIWPTHVGRVDLEGIERARDQLWAEALVLFKQGVKWWVDKRTYVLEPDDYPELDRPWSEWDVFDEQGDSRQISDAWETPIITWLATHNLDAPYSTAQLMGDALQLDRARWTPPEQKRVAAIMRKLGFKQKKCGPKHARVNGWVKDAPMESDDVPL